MKIGILGTGDVGRTLANAFLATGHQVMMGSREAANGKALAWAKQARGRGRCIDRHFRGRGEIRGRGSAGGVVVRRRERAEAGGAQNLAGKVVDVINPLTSGSRGLELAIGHTASDGEWVQRRLPGARAIKAFNSVGYARMFKPEFPDGPPDMFICGNDDAAKATVTGILTSFLGSTIDIGGIEGSRVLEPLCVLWLDYAMRAKSRAHAFKLLRK